MKTLEEQYDRLHGRRLALLQTKYMGGGLTEHEQTALSGLHKKIEKMAPDITPYILRRMAEITASMKIIVRHGGRNATE